jgi:hypothetical protein
MFKSKKGERKQELDIVFLVPKILEMKPEGRVPAVAPAETKDSIQSLGSSVMMTLWLVCAGMCYCRGPHQHRSFRPDPPVLLQKARLFLKVI